MRKLLMKSTSPKNRGHHFVKAGSSDFGGDKVVGMGEGLKYLECKSVFDDTHKGHSIFSFTRL